MERTNRVLLVQYSQTGSTARLADSFCAPLCDHPAIQVDKVALRPAPPYEFPWSFFSFFDAFPETVQLRAPALEPMPLEPDTRYDLVILAYPVWFLSPAPPMTAFLTSGAGRRVLADTPVITLIACRNMWLRAHETVSGLLQQAQAMHCDNVVVTDPGPSLATFVTTPRWMLTGRKDRFLGM
ncbi:MAG: dialkylresorcinol condensing enzyme, partial [Salinisphaera sp.]|nr:dialkylresorcinol condensing enzyme [Salinisphaera sp.]